MSVQSRAKGSMRVPRAVLLSHHLHHCSQFHQLLWPSHHHSPPGDVDDEYVVEELVPPGPAGKDSIRGMNEGFKECWASSSVPSARRDTSTASAARPSAGQPPGKGCFPLPSPLLPSSSATAQSWVCRIGALFFLSLLTTDFSATRRQLILFLKRARRFCCFRALNDICRARAGEKGRLFASLAEAPRHAAG